MTMCKTLFGCTIFGAANGRAYIAMRMSVRNIGVKCKITSRVRDSRINLFTIPQGRYVVILYPGVSLNK